MPTSTDPVPTSDAPIHDEIIHDPAVDATQSRVEAIAHPDDDEAPDNSALGRFKRSRYRSSAVFVGAVLMGGLLAPLVIHPRDSGPVAANELKWEMAMPASATTILQTSAAAGATISGQISPVADITGKAPVGGTVARRMVEPGARVEAGQTVVQITSGPATRAPLPGESRQIVAEKQQTDAANDQLALAQRLTTTQNKLRAAQERVTQAQDRISASRTLIARLRAGEMVVDSAPKTRNSNTRANPQLEAARAKASDAQARFDSTKSQLDAARAEQKAAQKSIAALQSKADEAAKNVATVETKFDGSLASAADVQAARSMFKNAQDTLKSATSRIEGAGKQIPELEKQLAQRERAADAARDAQSQLPATVRGDAPGRNQSSGGAVSIESAVKEANAALAESRAATKEADRLHALVDLYQEQAQRSNTRIETATRTLENTQNQVMQSVPRVRFSEARAPASGVVVWVASLAREVGAGQSVFGLSSGKRFAARFEDRSGNWKKARVGQTVSALIAPPAMSSATKPSASANAPATNGKPMPVEVPAPGVAAPPATSAPKPTILTAQTASALNAVAVSVKLTRIAPPETPGQPAILEGEVLPGAGAAAGPGWQLLASLPDSSKAAILTVPATAIVQRDAKQFVAVLEPVPATIAPEASTKATPAAIPAATTEETYQLQWQEVQLKPGDSVAPQIASGLRAGQRIITDPLPLLAQAPPEAKAWPQVKLAA